jgi:hypothetical protein
LIHIVQSISIFISNKKKRGCVRVERGSTISYIIYIGGAIRFLPSANRNNWICSQLPGNKLFFSGTLISLVRPWVCKAERERERESGVSCVRCSLPPLHYGCIIAFRIYLLRFRNSSFHLVHRGILKDWERHGEKGRIPPPSTRNMHFSLE